MSVLLRVFKFHFFRLLLTRYKVIGLITTYVTVNNAIIIAMISMLILLLLRFVMVETITKTDAALVS